MATNITVYDLDSYPDNSKTVVVDHKQVVPTGYLGDEQWVLTAYTTATASGSATIQDVFIRSFTVGWAKSAGFSQGPFTVDASQNSLKVSINGSTYRTITLTVQATPVSGTAIAEDMQTKISNLAITGGAEAGNLAFKNAWVTFEDGKFIIQSGTPTKSYTGSSKSSVSVLPADTYDISRHLGFFAPTTSEGIASNSVTETYLSFPYTSISGLTLIDVNTSSVAGEGDCIGITDGTNTEYRYVSSVSAGVINFNAALDNDYALYSRVQVLRMQDPDSNPASVFDSVDEVTRFAVSTIVNQIDFSS